jgi:hypothetical protein
MEGLAFEASAEIITAMITKRQTCNHEAKVRVPGACRVE